MIRRLTYFLLTLLLFPLGANESAADWKVDLSRRSEELSRAVIIEAKQEPKKTRGLFKHILNSGQPIQELVILNTERGFVPSSVQVEKGRHYKIHVVNVAEEAKNVSFVMDDFGQHHATYYGQLKTFLVKPDKEGVYRFVCPETSAQGRFVVYSPSGPEIRMPAAEE